MTVVLAWSDPAQGPSWNPNAHYALVRALADGRPNIDRSIRDVFGGTRDFAYFHGHRYAAKAPGLAFWMLPAYLVLKAVGQAKPGGGTSRTLWLLGLWASVLPAAVLFLLVRTVAESYAPGYGTLTAMMLAVATLILPFATLVFAHMLTAALGFAAFALLWRERQSEARLRLVALAGLLAGLAVTVEFPSALLVAALGGYALLRRGRVARTLAYAAGAALGVVPLLLFNQWAFGSMTHLSYAGAAGGLNRQGFFGLGTPSFHVASALLFANVGLVRVAPVLLLGILGIGLLYRRGARAEALLIACVSLAYLIFNSGYETAFGGGTPGPRFLVPVIPFLVVPIGLVYECAPITAIALAIVSAVEMTVITMTNPLSAIFRGWFLQLRIMDYGISSPRLLLFAVLVLLAAVFALLATPPPRLTRRDLLRGALALLAWAVIAHQSPKLIHDGGPALLLLYGAIAIAAVTVFVVPRLVLSAPRGVEAPTR